MSKDKEGPKVINFDTGEEIPDGKVRARTVSVIIPEHILAILVQYKFVEDLGDDQYPHYYFNLLPFLEQLAADVYSQTMATITDWLVKGLVFGTLAGVLLWYLFAKVF